MDWEINHDELANLSDDEFAAKRAEIINAYIDGLPKDKQLDAKLFQQAIDVELDSEPNDDARMNKISEMVADRIDMLQTALADLRKIAPDSI
jgi:hypothetical protein